MQYLLDPTGELEPIFKKPLEKITATPNVTVGLIDISKAKGDVFLNRIEKLFVQKGVQTKRYKKPTFTRPAPVNLVQKISSEVLKELHMEFLKGFINEFLRRSLKNFLKVSLSLKPLSLKGYPPNPRDAVPT